MFLIDINRQLAELIEQLGIAKDQINLHDLPAFIASAKSTSPQSCSSFLKSSFFKENSFVGLISYLRDMMNKSNEENTQFFRYVATRFYTPLYLSSRIALCNPD